MKIYEFNCYDIKYNRGELIFSADAFPLEQNCDVVKLYKRHNITRLEFWRNEGTKKVDYVPAFEYIYINSLDKCIDIYISDDNLQKSQYPIGFEIIHIILKKSELLYQLQSLFVFDKMISLEQWQ